MSTKDLQGTNRSAILIRGLIVLVCAGIINATSVFVTPLAAYYGWDPSAIANIGTTMLTFWPIGSLLGGKLLQKLGGKTVVLIGAIVFGTGLITTAMVPVGNPGMLYFTFSFLIGMGNGITYCGTMYCVMGWFPDKKGLATGLCMAFNGGSSAFLAPLCASITAMSNVKVTLISCGVVAMVVCIICGLGIKSAPVGYVPEGYVPPASGEGLVSQYESIPISKAWKTRQFWLQLGAMAFFPSFYLIMFSRFSMFMTDKGIDLAYATLGVSIYNIGNVVGRLGLGKLTDNIGYKKVYGVCWTLCMVSGACLLTGNSVATILIAYFCLGAGFGSTNSVYPVITTTSFGPIYAGNIYGFALLGYMAMTQIIPRVTAASIAATGTYTIAFVMAFILCTLGVICGFSIPKLARKRLNDTANN
ncbi:MFS transporter [Oscillibacter sp.]|uniref:MFS transporter n=1 Tax=Oscillibacter sp. TaxID=1945593 RepID=UPI0028967243|nr:MFS transporter [Oscillibacter sp.]